MTKTLSLKYLHMVFFLPRRGESFHSVNHMMAISVNAMNDTAIVKKKLNG